MVRVEIDPPAVEAAFESTTRDFQKQAALPGFRPGKAPRDMVAKRYEKDIHDEVKRKLISDAYRKAVEEQKLDVVGNPDIEEIQFARGQALQFAATIETAPDFQLPEYKGLPVPRDNTTVTAQDVERALQLLRERHMDYKTVERAALATDFAIVNFTGACNGKPITETAPTAAGLTEQKNRWISLGEESFIPGFGVQLIGLKAGEKKTVNVDFPADFVTPQLAGQKGVYEVEVVEIKERTMPELDDAFAKSYGAETLEKLREGVTKDLENELEYKKRRAIRNRLVEQLLGRVSFELPESLVTQETRNVVYDIVRENQKRGVPMELIEKEKDNIYNTAAGSARTRVKANFLLRKISEKEGIKVTQQEVLQRIQHLAASYDISPDQFIKDLRKRDGIIEIYDQVGMDKALEFLQQHASFEDAPASPAAPAAAPEPAAAG
jgi:trigger factor